MTEVQFSDELEVKLHDYMGSDSSIVQAMMVSTKGISSADAEATAGRINALMRNRHGTPFEHNSMTFLVAAPIFVFREFHRHRVGFSYNEMSGRYRQLPAKFYIPPQHRPLQQVGKAIEYKFQTGSHGQYNIMYATLSDIYRVVYRQYEMLLEYGVAKEVARMILPVGLYSEMFVTCNARSLMHFLSLRTVSDRARYPSTPMWEIAQVATAMEDGLKEVFPLTHEAFEKHGRVAP